MFPLASTSELSDEAHWQLLSHISGAVGAPDSKSESISEEILTSCSTMALLLGCGTRFCLHTFLPNHTIPSGNMPRYSAKWNRKKKLLNLDVKISGFKILLQILCE